MNITGRLVDEAARAIAFEHGSTVFDDDHEPYEFTEAEREQYRAEARAVAELLAFHAPADVVTLLRQLAGEPELVIDGPGDRLPVDATTAMHLLARAADWLETHLKETR